MSHSSLSHTHRLPPAPNSQINMLISQYTLSMPRKNQIAHFIMINSIVNQIPEDGIYPSLVCRLISEPRAGTERQGSYAIATLPSKDACRCFSVLVWPQYFLISQVQQLFIHPLIQQIFTECPLVPLGTVLRAEDTALNKMDCPCRAYILAQGDRR